MLDRIAAASERAGRDPSGVALLAVTKGVSPGRIAEAASVGISRFGENRVQEASAKVGLPGGASWALIGRLQANKARRAIELFDSIHSVDSLGLARRLDRIAAEGGRSSADPYPILLQVNVDDDPAKGGFPVSTLERELPEIASLSALRLDGLMTVGRLEAAPEARRSTFRRLAELSGRLRERQPRLGDELSMGMSDDFELAAEEGATMVRLGRALFGERPGA